MIAESTSTREEALWQAYTADRSIANRNALAEFYLPLVRLWAAKFCTRKVCAAHYDDLVTVAMERLLTHAVPNFDSSRNLRFATYLAPHVWGAMLDYLRSIDTASRSQRTFIRRCNYNIGRFRRAFGRDPTNAELAERLQVTEPELDRRRHVPERAFLDQYAGKLNILEQLLPAGPQRCEDEGLFDLLTRGVDPDAKVCLRLYFWHGVTMKRIAKLLGLSESRVSQMMAQAIQFMRKHRDPVESFALVRQPTPSRVKEVA